MRAALVLFLFGCGATPLVVVAPTEARIVRAALVDGAGQVIGRCEGEFGCLVPLDGGRAGTVEVQIAEAGRVQRHTVDLRGSEVALDVSTSCVVREQSAEGLILTLAPTAAPDVDLPVVLLENRTEATLHGMGPNGLLAGTLHRLDGDRWVQVGGWVGCGTVMGSPVAPGRTVEIDAPDYLGDRPPIDPAARYRFLLEVRVGGRSETGCPTDTMAASLELTGAQILAQGQAPTE